MALVDRHRMYRNCGPHRRCRIGPEQILQSSVGVRVGKSQNGLDVGASYGAKDVLLASNGVENEKFENCSCRGVDHGAVFDGY